VWELAAGEAAVHLPGHSRRAFAAVSPDGRLVATGDHAGIVRFWNAATGVKQREWESGLSPARVLRFSPDGSLLAVGTEDGRVKLWDVAAHRAAGELKAAPMEGGSIGLTFLRGGRLVAAAPGGGLRVLSLPDVSVVSEIPGDGVEVSSIIPAPDEQTLMLRRRDRTMRLVHPDGTSAGEVPRATHGWGCGFNADGTLWASAYPETGIALWDTETWKKLDGLSEEGGHSGAILWHPTDPAILFSASASGIVSMWDVPARRELLRLEALGALQVMVLSVSADGRRLCASGGGKVPVVWDLWRFDHHIAGNLEFQIQRQAAKLPPEVTVDAAREWARRVMSGKAPLPRNPAPK
jgi:WD40 repeat protein